jgi:hypothetical protein
VYSLLVGPQIPHERGVDEAGLPPPDGARRLAAHAAAAEGERPSGRARGLGAGGGADRAPLHERVRLADVVAAGPGHRHLVVGLALREAREHGRLGVLERDRLRHRDQLRLHGSRRCNETACIT